MKQYITSFILLFIILLYYIHLIVNNCTKLIDKLGTKELYDALSLIY